MLATYITNSVQWRKKFYENKIAFTNCKCGDWRFGRLSASHLEKIYLTGSWENFHHLSCSIFKYSVETFSIPILALHVHELILRKHNHSTIACRQNKKKNLKASLFAHFEICMDKTHKRGSIFGGVGAESFLSRMDPVLSILYILSTYLLHEFVHPCIKFRYFFFQRLNFSGNKIRKVFIWTV